MTQQQASEQTSPGLLSALYSLAAWVGLLVLTGILVWLVWTLLSRTDAGTADSQAMALARAQLPTLVASLPSPTPGCRPVDLPIACGGCHTIDGTSAAGVTGPDLTHIASVATQRINDPAYVGAAKSAADYIRESILQPSAFVVPGEGYGRPEGTSLMPVSAGESLQAPELDRLVADLACLQ